MLLTKESRLSEGIFLDSSLIPVIYRFGIALGVGDKTVEEICEQKKLSTGFFLAIINTFLNASYIPEDVEDIFETKILLDYLEKTNDYYSRVQLPNIERHFKLLIERSPADNNLENIFTFFMEMKEDLECGIVSDHSDWFPKIRRQIEDTIYVSDSVNVDIENYFSMLPEGLGNAFLDFNNVEEKLNDLASIFVVHLKGEYDRNLCMAVVNSIFHLRKDVNQNNRIRNRILLPAVMRLFGFGGI